MDLNIHSPLPQKKDWRIGIIGSGFIVSDCHLVAYRKAGFNPVAIASRTRESAEKVAQRHGIPKVYDRVEQLLDDRSIEVLDIAVPPNAQFAIIKAACARKTVKGILAQKPLGMDYREALAAVELCEAAGITLAVNQNMRYDQSVRAAKTLLTNGTIGDPVFATIDMRGIPHWMPWQKDLGWVTLRIMSIHHLDCFRYWFGDPERIYCSVRKDPRTEFPHEDGIATYILEYRNGLRCVGIDDTWTGPAKEGCPSDIRINWRIEGLNGLAMGDIGWCKDPYTSPSTIRYASKGTHGFQSPVWSESWFPDAFIGPMAQLLIALEQGARPAIDGRDNLKTMALVDAAYQSVKWKTAIDIQDIYLAALAEEVEVERPKRQAHNARNTEYTPLLQEVLFSALWQARVSGANCVGDVQLALGLLEVKNGLASKILSKLIRDESAVKEELSKLYRSEIASPETARWLPYTPRSKKILAIAKEYAVKRHCDVICTEDLLLGILAGAGKAAEVLTRHGVTSALVEETMAKAVASKLAL